MYWSIGCRQGGWRARLTAFTGILALAASALAGNHIAMLKVAAGDVRLERGGQVQSAVGGATLQVGDRLLTGADGSAGVTFDDNTRVSLGPNSDYRIERFAFNTTTNAGSFESRLQAGSLAMISGKLAKQSPDAIKVRTPANILGVRGTRFIVEVSP